MSIAEEFIVQIDFRERESGNIDRLKSMGVEVDVIELQVADYIIGAFGVERKTVEDYYASLLSGHLNQQLYELSHNFDFSFLVIIGVPTIDMLDKSFSRRTFISSLIGSCTKKAIDGRRGQIILLQFETEEDFCLFIYLLNKRAGGSFFRFPAIEKRRSYSKEEISVGMLSMIDGIGEKKARLLLKKFKSIFALSLASVDEIREIKTIGKENATNVYNTLRNIDLIDRDDLNG